MPELPEVETVKRGLSQLVVGKTISNVEFDWPKSFPNDPHAVKEFLIGASISGIRRRAKVLIIELDNQYALVVHLKMTGQLVYMGDSARFGAGHPTDSLIHELPDKSTRVTITFADGTKLFFNDQRKFGWMRLMPDIEVAEIDFMRRVGPEPLDSSFRPKEFIERMRRRKGSTIKSALLDQTVLAGVGNIYADEVLYAARVHPARRVGDVSDAKLRVILKELKRILLLSIEKGGSTDKNYVNAEGKKGSYLTFAKVFRQEGMPCERHPGSRIIKTKVAGRGTHLCPRCQPAPKGFKA